MFGDAGAFSATLLICVGYIFTLGWLSRRGVLERNLARKLMHVGNGLLFVCCWPLYSSLPRARYICASVPFLASIHFWLVGMGCVQDVALIQSATRTGDRRELLRGPLLYGLVISALTVLFWRGSPVGVLAIAVLCAGDGAADIIGRRFGHSNKLPYSPQKSAAGSAACFGAGFLGGLFCLWYLQRCGVADRELSAALMLIGALTATAVGTAVESLPIPEIDNLTMPLAVALVSNCLFDSQS